MREFIVKLIFGIYQSVISPTLHFIAGPGWGCRYTPSCGHYARDAVLRFGFIRGGWIGFKRLASCHPFSRFGFDPVPEKEIK